MVNLTKQREADIDKIQTLAKTLKKMESQPAVSKSVNETFQNQIISLERQFWKSEQYSRRDCIEIAEILDTTNETKVCDLI